MALPGSGLLPLLPCPGFPGPELHPRASPLDPGAGGRHQPSAAPEAEADKEPFTWSQIQPQLLSQQGLKFTICATD